jgi:hypothetical protein
VMSAVVLILISSKLSFLSDTLDAYFGGGALVSADSSFPNSCSKGSSFGFCIFCAGGYASKPKAASVLPETFFTLG